jgi:hypothetical protein
MFASEFRVPDFLLENLSPILWSTAALACVVALLPGWLRRRHEAVAVKSRIEERYRQIK